MNLYNPIFWIVAPFIRYQIVHVPTYLGLKGIPIFWTYNMIFLLLDDMLIWIHKIRAILCCIAKNKGMYKLVLYELYDIEWKYELVHTHSYKIVYSKEIHDSISFLWHKFMWISIMQIHISQLILS